MRFFERVAYEQTPRGENGGQRPQDRPGGKGFSRGNPGSVGIRGRFPGNRSLKLAEGERRWLPAGRRCRGRGRRAHAGSPPTGSCPGRIDNTPIMELCSPNGSKESARLVPPLAGMRSLSFLSALVRLFRKKSSPHFRIFFRIAYGRHARKLPAFYREALFSFSKKLWVIVSRQRDGSIPRSGRSSARTGRITAGSFGKSSSPRSPTGRKRSAKTSCSFL